MGIGTLIAHCLDRDYNWQMLKHSQFRICRFHTHWLAPEKGVHLFELPAHNAYTISIVSTSCIYAIEMHATLNVDDWVCFDIIAKDMVMFCSLFS